MEFVNGVGGRRRWRVEEKLRIVAEAAQPDASLSDVARRHQINRGLLRTWRCQVHDGVLTPEPAFMPVQVMGGSPGSVAPAPSSACAATDKATLAGTGRIEIALPDGICIRVGADVGLDALRRVMAAVRA